MSTNKDKNKVTVNKIHLIILVHGLWGNVSHMDYISKQFQELNTSGASNELLYVHVSSSNEHYKTYDGIDVCGTRLYQEIDDLMDKITQKNETSGTQLQITGEKNIIVKFSMIGYSLGGLIARYACGLLHSNNTFSKYSPTGKLELVNFTTFCTPHVGVYAPGINAGVKIFNNVVPKLLGNSGKQIFLKDSNKLLYLMSLPSSKFVKSLSNFRNLSLYSNCINDTRTAYWTSGISKNDPFFDLIDNNNPMLIEKFNYIKNYEPIVLNNQKPIRIVSFDSKTKSLSTNEVKSSIDSLPGTNDDVKVDVMTEFYFLDYWTLKIFKWVSVISNFCILLIISPIIILKSSSKSLYEQLQSSIRVKKFYQSLEIYDYIEHEHSVSKTLFLGRNPSSLKETPNLATSSLIHKSATNGLLSEDEQTFDENFENGVDTFVNSLYDAIERVEVKNARVGGRLDSTTKSNQLLVPIKDLETHSLEELSEKYSKHCIDHEDKKTIVQLLENFKLEINNEDQLSIIDNLNNHLNWKKFPILIRNTKSSHAAAIVRHNDPLFDEGKVVIQHYINEVFQL